MFMEAHNSIPLDIDAILVVIFTPYLSKNHFMLLFHLLQVVSSLKVFLVAFHVHFMLLHAICHTHFILF